MGRSSPTRNEREALIRELQRHGATQSQIADRLGVSQQRIAQTIRPNPHVGGIPCPDCGSGSLTIRTWPIIRQTIQRTHRCKACGSTWRSIQRNMRPR